MYTPQETQYVLANAGTQTIDQIAKATGKTRKSLFLFLRARGIDTTTNPNLCDVRTDQFVNVTTPYVAYLLGFVWADGTVVDNTIVVDCVEDDMNVIESVFDQTGGWRKTSMQRPNKRASRIFRAYNPTLCAYLASKGYRDKASRSQVPILDAIPANLHPFFWRGYFDGDGCVYRSGNGSTKVSIAGGYDQDWTALQRLGTELGIPVSIVRRIQNARSRSSAAHVHGQHHMLTFLGWIYQGFEEDRIGLKRKHDKYLEAKRHVASRPLANTGYIGVTKVKSGRFVAQLKEGGSKTKVMHYLGTYDTPQEAAKAYDAEALKRRGRETRLNFPSSIE